MQLKDTRREIKTIDLLPLINVVFLLILFVLIAGRPSTNHPSGSGGRAQHGRDNASGGGALGLAEAR